MAKLNKRTRRIIILCAVFVMISAVITAIVLAVAINKKSKTEEQSKLEYKTLAEVLAEAPNALGKTYDNMTLPESVSLPSPEKLHTMSVDNSAEHITEEQLKQKCIDTAKYMNGEQPDANKITIETYSAGRFDCQYFPEGSDNENYNYNIKLESSGGCLIWEPDIISGEAGDVMLAADIAKAYTAEDNGLASVVGDLAGEDYTAKQALEFAQKTIDNVLPLCADQYETKPVIVCILNDEYDEHQSFLVRFALCADGVEFDLTDTAHVGGANMTVNYADVVITHPDVVTQVYCYTYTRGIEKTELEDKFITLDSALRHASAEFAPYFTNAVTDINIVYALPSFPESSEENEETEPYEYRPMWRLSLDEPNNLKIRCIYIDMVTGDLIYSPCNGTLVSNKYDKPRVEK